MITIRHWNAILGALALLLLSACGSDRNAAPTSPSPAEKAVVTPSISGTVTAMSGGSQSLSIPFNASESATLSNLTVTGLASLPPGWSSPSEFSCATVSTGNGCLLTLTFAPTNAASGTLTLGYTYTDNRGDAQNGSLTIPYSSTTNNNVVATASPGGQVAAIVASGSQAVTVTFDTDDGNPATALTLSIDLGALPAGWSTTATNFSCATVSTGNGCQLPLNFAPAAIGGGTLTLSFSYVDNSGDPKTGTVSIPYSATTNNNIVAAASPSGQVDAVVGGASQAVTLTFATDDGNPATVFSLTTSLGSLPTGWSSNASSLTCTSVASGNSCQLMLNYTPTAAGSGTLQIAYGYQSNSGAAKTGSVSIAYAATNAHAYISDPNSSPLVCSINTDGTLSNCATLGQTFNIWDLAFKGNKVYMSNISANNISVCSVAMDGTFSNCATSGSNMQGPYQMTIQGPHLYVSNAGGAGPAVTMCDIDPASGALSNCVGTGASSQSASIALSGSYAYMNSSGATSSTINVCSIDASTGLLGACAATPQSGQYWLTAANGYLYTSQATDVGVCPISINGSIPTCTTSSIAAGLSRVWSVTVNGSRAYVAANTSGGPPFFMSSYNIYLCSVSATDGSLSNCVVSNGGVANPYFWLHVIIN